MAVEGARVSVDVLFAIHDCSPVTSYSGVRRNECIATLGRESRLFCCRLLKQSSAGLSDAWEARMRDTLSGAGVQKHVRGFEVPLEQQVATLARTVRHIFSPSRPACALQL